jgi:hypothetical protein
LTPRSQFPLEHLEQENESGHIDPKVIFKLLVICYESLIAEMRASGFVEEKAKIIEDA